MYNVMNNAPNKSISKSEFKEASVSIDNAPEPMKSLPEFDPFIRGSRPIVIKQPTFMKKDELTCLLTKRNT